MTTLTQLNALLGVWALPARAWRMGHVMVAVIMCASGLRAQAPAWEVNPSAYQYSMNIVAFLNVNHQTLTGDHDKVAALVDGTVRGVASPIYVASTDRYLAYLTVYANKEGEQVQFRIYDSSGGSIAEVDTTLTFRIDGQVGNGFQAFSLANPALKQGAEFTNFFFTGVDSVSTVISPGEIDITVEYDVDVTTLVPEFAVSEGATVYIDAARQESGGVTMDFSQPLVYTVLSEDESVSHAYEIKVANRVTTDGDFTSTNVITANNDGSNDFWIVTDVFKYKDYEFTIVDANGRVLYRSMGYDNKWNGYYKGDRLARGKYYFIVRDPNSDFRVSGDILVLY